jgi:pyruvate kinase
MLRQLAEAGCDCFRINFSHGSEEQRLQFLTNIRQVEADLGAGEPLGVMADLCGPKIRVGPVAGGSTSLSDGQQLVIQREFIEGGPTRISTTLAELIDHVEVGQTILLNDGRIRLDVIETRPPDEIVCEVVHGGALSNGKGVNLPQTPLVISALTEKDRQDAVWIARQGFDWVALSFVRSPDDVLELRDILESEGCGAHIVAKIEKPQGLERIEEIVDVADAIMVARGDLGIELDLPAVPVAQKRIARLCQTAGKPCIIATQMLETMTSSPIPTRAEVSDVANAVLDMADAVMLSGETAIGRFPAATVAMMNNIVSRIQTYADETATPARVTDEPGETTAALACAVREIIQAQDIAAVAVFTATGMTARMLAKSRLPCAILAMSPDISAVRRMCMYYGVLSVRVDAPKHTRDVLAMVSRLAIQKGLAEIGQKVVALSGRPIDQHGATNTLVVHTVQ